jgi:nucleoid DNA-binding protein
MKIEVTHKRLPFFRVGRELEARLNDGGEGSG